MESYPVNNCKGFKTIVHNLCILSKRLENLELDFVDNM